MIEFKICLYVKYPLSLNLLIEIDYFVGRNQVESVYVGYVARIVLN